MLVKSIPFKITIISLKKQESVIWKWLFDMFNGYLLEIHQKYLILSSCWKIKGWKEEESQNIRFFFFLINADLFDVENRMLHDWFQRNNQAENEAQKCLADRAYSFKILWKQKLFKASRAWVIYQRPQKRRKEQQLRLVDKNFNVQYFVWSIIILEIIPPKCIVVNEESFIVRSKRTWSH